MVGTGRCLATCMACCAISAVTLTGGWAATPDGRDAAAAWVATSLAAGPVNRWRRLGGSGWTSVHLATTSQGKQVVIKTSKKPADAAFLGEVLGLQALRGTGSAARTCSWANACACMCVRVCVHACVRVRGSERDAGAFLSERIWGTPRRSVTVSCPAWTRSSRRRQALLSDPPAWSQFLCCRGPPSPSQERRRCPSPRCMPARMIRQRRGVFWCSNTWSQPEGPRIRQPWAPPLRRCIPPPSRQASSSAEPAGPGGGFSNFHPWCRQGVAGSA